MNLISYAQNHEDILLWRALKHIKTGFYVDVGANDPSDDSVTKLFYERGWSGINIEPSQEVYANLCQERSRDINLCCAVGAHEGLTTFYDVPTRGWSTSDPGIGEYRRSQDHAVDTREVPIHRLDGLLEKYCEGPLHFLKIDVEGAEANVLQGLDLHRFRPWILLIESVSPITNEPDYEEWESGVLGSRYKFVYFDGLNRFYIAEERWELSQAFSSPPNVLDQFSPQSLVHWLTKAQQAETKAQQAETKAQQAETKAQQAETKAQQAETKAQQAETKAQQAETKAQQAEVTTQQAETKAQQAEAELASVYRSRSWRITRPLRGITSISCKVYLKGRAFVKRFVAYGKSLAIRCLASFKTFLNRYPRLKRRIVSILMRSPKLNQYLRRVLFHRPQAVTSVLPSEVADVRSTSQSFNPDRFALPLPAGQRTLYVFVDHTIACSTNTGMQRVTRGLAAGLIGSGERVRYVKWHAASKQCVLINLAERQYLAQWNGPPVTVEDTEIYSDPDAPCIPVESQPIGKNHWLLVPEVTHITFQEYPITLNLLMWARQAGLKTGFVFYDAIPLYREEFADMAPKHALYMQQLLLSDVVWPISAWAANELLSYWKKYESADVRTIPTVSPILLSGESQLCERISTPIPGEKLILAVGTLEPRKNQVALIHAFEAHCKHDPTTEWKLVLVGNLHPAVADVVNRAVQTNPRIQHLGHVTDEDLDTLYRTCSFTVFPSVQEGFGLPILESLWYGKPCICANFGSMVEVAVGGGCFTLNTADQAVLDNAVTRLMEDADLHHALTEEAIARPITTWNDYAASICAYVQARGSKVASLGTVYYWIDATLQFPKNTGIQRVARQLARGLIEIGLAVVPVKWDKANARFGPVSSEELAFLSEWNGPSATLWQDWLPPNSDQQNGWFFMPELPLNLSSAEREQVIDGAREAGLHCAAVFYDAIPWKMRGIYPTHFAQAHREYMLELGDYDLVLPISDFSCDDLIDFLGAELSKPQSLEPQIKSVSLPGEFAESARVKTVVPRTKSPVTLLCVGTVEPRKNHETLLKAFAIAAKRSKVAIKLVIAGNGHSIEPALADRVRAFITEEPNIIWEDNADDTRLRELHLECDLTIYPSVEEGFGLPILESLWYAKPCICASFGAMQEVAKDGGCLMVDVRSVEVLAEAIQSLAEDAALRNRLAHEAANRLFKSWQDYALAIAMRLVQATPMPITGEWPLTSAAIEQYTQAMRVPPRPLLSICISTYNRAEWLATSLKNWTRLYPDPLPEVEFLVCDNTSTDHTPQVVKPYLDRTDFAYHRNVRNVGMLGNLRETAHYARGEYVWIIGDDDLLMPGAIERILATLQAHPQVALVYLNYAFTRIDDARTVTDFNVFFRDATPIVPAEGDREGPIRTICAQNENFFTAIYTLVLRRDHALRAYSQDTSGRPFSTLLTCIPTTYYVLNHMMEQPGVWIGTPQIVVNMNVSWMKYAPLWILERIPEVYEEAERRGVAVEDIDRWRLHTLPGVMHYFDEIFQNDPLNNAAYFSPGRLVRRFKHLPEFRAMHSRLRAIYENAHAIGHPAALAPVSRVFPETPSE
jgi:FkbM family methyltransferase